MRRLALVTALALAWTGSASADELSDLKAQLDSAKQLIQQLEKRVQALEAAPPAAAAPVAGAPAASAPAAQAAAPAVPSGGIVIAPNEVPAKGVTDANGARLEIYGFAQADFIYDFKRMDPDWSATLRPSKIPVVCTGPNPDPGCGDYGQTTFSVRQTRLGFKGFLPTEAGELKTRFEFDLFGVGADAGQTTFRLRQAYGELGPYLAGQTDSLFMDGSVFPNTIDYWGPGGMIFFRNIQARYTPINGDGRKFAIAIEAPGAAIDSGNAGTPYGWQAHNKYPDVTAQYRFEPEWGHLQAAGIVRYLGYQDPSFPTTDDSGYVTGYGLNLTGSYKVGRQDRIMAQFAYGKGIAGYFNDCCVDVAPNSDGKAEAVPVVGWLVYYDHFWNERFSSAIGWSGQFQDNTDGQAPTSFHAGQYGSANLLYYPIKNVMTGMELLYGKRENLDGESAYDTRVQFSTQFKF